MNAGSDNHGQIRISTPDQNLGHADIFLSGVQE